MHLCLDRCALAHIPMMRQITQGMPACKASISRAQSMQAATCPANVRPCWNPLIPPTNYACLPTHPSRPAPSPSQPHHCTPEPAQLAAAGTPTAPLQRHNTAAAPAAVPAQACLHQQLAWQHCCPCSSSMHSCAPHLPADATADGLEVF
jgi:hypothetical protein